MVTKAASPDSRSAARGATENERPLKDAVLAALSETTNVAQFVSFGPGSPPKPRFVRVRGVHAEPSSVEDAVQSLLARSVEQRVNVRSFRPEQPKSNEFIYGLSTSADAAGAVRRLAARGLYTIVNETIDINDGGVSGVSYGGIVEFAPEDTPRCVEKPGTAALPLAFGLSLLETVYGFRPMLDEDPRQRVEFSIHPLRRGYHHEHTIIWELERYEQAELVATVSWPNRFSRFIGDKTFGLLVADALALPVPRTTVVARHIAPLTFGTSTETGETWVRTAPTEQVPGKFMTQRGWTDPFGLLQREDPAGTAIAAVLSQEGVDAKYAGVAATGPEGGLIVEGVGGYGDDFMQGKARPSELPREIVNEVELTYQAAADALGPVRFEWVHDGSRVWVVQLHRGALPSGGRIIYPGVASEEHRFDVTHGLEELRDLVALVQGTSDGIVLLGSVGLTSHFGDVLRKARIPSRIEDNG
jgi:hypothetical protein